MWIDKMLDCIKLNKSRMEIAAKIGIPVHHVSKEAFRMIHSHDYRKAGITDRQFAEWFDASLIGLQTEEGEPATERTKPDAEHVEMILRRIYSEPIREHKTDIKQTGGNSCLNCKRRGTFLCKHYNRIGTKAVICGKYRRI